MSQMRITEGKGVCFTFENAITISVQIGGGNYSDNYREPIGRFERPEGYTLPASTTAEIAIWAPDGEFANISGDMVKGYVPVDDVLRFIEFLRSLPSDLTKDEIELATNPFDWRDGRSAKTEA